MIRNQLILDINEGLIVVLFAGAGGMCHAIERAFGRHVDIACNHNANALAVHRINHPQTRHYICDVRELDPRVVCEGRPVDHLHLSPDCTHFSQAAEGQPRDEEIRSLSWVLRYWTGTVKPRLVTFENVKQVKKWGPLIAKRCKVTGRVIKRDKTVAAPGERVPRHEQFLVPDPKREGLYWNRLMRFVEQDGYTHGDGNLVAANYGAPTTRDRLFMVCRNDGDPIVLPVPTHAKKPKRGQKRWRPAAECIDWSVPVPSIFTRARPLVDATCRRIARGIVEFVLTHPNPYIVDLSGPAGERRSAAPLVAPICQTNGGNKVNSAADPFPTMTAHPKGGHLALCAPVIVPCAHYDGTVRANDASKPFPTITVNGGGYMGLAAAFMAQHNGGNWADNPGHDLRKPFSTITGRATQQQLVTAHVATLRRNSYGQHLRDPLGAITTSGNHHGVVTCNLQPQLTPDEEAGALRCAAFIMRYYSNGGQLSDPRLPMPTVTTKDRLALVTVWIQGLPRVIVDIGMRMFVARELFLGMGFLPSFIIDEGMFELPDGRLERRRITSTVQKELCGNAVSPDPAMALLLANAPHLVRIDKERRTA